MAWKSKRMCKWTALALPVLLAAALFAHEELLAAVGNYLTAPRTQQWAENVVILGGDGRFEVVAEAIQNGHVKTVLLLTSRPDRLVRAGLLPSDHQLAQRELTERDVDPEKLHVLPEPVSGNFEIAMRLADWLKDNPTERLTVVCSELSSGELQWLFEKQLGADADRVTWWPLSDLRFNATNWWRHRHGVLRCFDAYMSLLFVSVNGPGADTYQEVDPQQWISEQPRDS